MLKSFPKCYLFTGPWKPGREAGGELQPPPSRFLLKLTFYQLTIIVKRKKIQTSSNSAETTASITFVQFMKSWNKFDDEMQKPNFY